MDWIYEQVVAAIARLVRPFADWWHGLNLIYLVSALLLAIGILWWQRRNRPGRPRRRSFLAEALPLRILLHPSCRRDYAILFLNNGVFFFLSAWIILSPALVADWIAATDTAKSYGEASSGAGLAWQIAFSLYWILAWDFFASLSHYLKHQIPLLWEFHKVHHSAEAMTPVTNFRRHPVDFLFSSIVIVLGTGVAQGLWYVIIGPVGPVLGYFGIPVVLGLWYLTGYNLRHSHVWIGYGPFWSRVFISPAQHQIHHSRDPRHHHRNFGLIFSFWDSLFGTLYVPTRREQIRYGIDPSEQAGYRTLVGLYLTPFKNAARRFGRAAK